MERKVRDLETYSNEELIQIILDTLHIGTWEHLTREQLIQVVLEINAW